jgi:hypothetical protein
VARSHAPIIVGCGFEPREEREALTFAAHPPPPTAATGGRRVQPLAALAIMSNMTYYRLA